MDGRIGGKRSETMRSWPAILLLFIMIMSLILPVVSAKGGGSGSSSYSGGNRGVYYGSGGDSDEDEDEGFEFFDVECFLLAIFLPIFIIGWLIKRGKGRRKTNWDDLK